MCFATLCALVLLCAMLCTILYVLCWVVCHVAWWIVCSILSCMPCWLPVSVKSLVFPPQSTGCPHPNTILGILETDTLISNNLSGMWRTHRLARLLWKRSSQSAYMSIMVKPDGVVFKQHKQANRNKTVRVTGQKLNCAVRPMNFTDCERNCLVEWEGRKFIST